MSSIQDQSFQEVIADGQNGSPIVTHPARNHSGLVTCILIAGTNTGKIQFTGSPLKDIRAGTATWHDWDKGTSTGNDVSVIAAPVKAVRGVSVSGEVKVEFVY